MEETVNAILDGEVEMIEAAPAHSFKNLPGIASYKRMSPRSSDERSSDKRTTLSPRSSDAASDSFKSTTDIPRSSDASSDISSYKRTTLSPRSSDSDLAARKEPKADLLAAGSSSSDAIV